MSRLADIGIVRHLGPASAYRNLNADNPQTRAAIAASIIPARTIACHALATWVWLGGEFPGSIDVISTSHYRALKHGRRVRVFNRKAPDEHLTWIGRCALTTPLRTACDLALSATSTDTSPTANTHLEHRILALATTYQFTMQDCLQLLNEHRFWPNAPAARQLLSLLAEQERYRV